MKTDKPYINVACCPECWIHWTAFCPYGIDEEQPLECPTCRQMVGRVISSELAGDQLRDLYKRLDEEKEKLRQAREDAADKKKKDDDDKD